MTNLLTTLKATLLFCSLAYDLTGYSQTEIDLTDKLIDKQSQFRSMDYIFPDGTFQFKIGNGIYKIRPDGTLNTEPQSYRIADKPAETMVMMHQYKTEQLRMRKTDWGHAISYIVTTDSIIIERMYADRPNEFFKYALPMVHHPRKTNEVIRSIDVPECSLDFPDETHVLYSEIVMDRCAESDAQNAKGTYKSNSYLRMVSINLTTGACSQVITMVNEFSSSNNWDPMAVPEDDIFSLGGIWQGKKIITRVTGKGKTRVYNKANTAIKVDGAGKIELFGVDLTTGQSTVLDVMDYAITPEFASYRINLDDGSAIIQRSGKVGKDQFKPELTLYEVKDGKFVQSTMAFPDDFVTVSPGLSEMYVIDFGQKKIPYVELKMVNNVRDRQPVTAYAYFVDGGLQFYKGDQRYAIYKNNFLPVAIIDEISRETLEQLTNDFADSSNSILFGIYNNLITGYSLSVTDKMGMNMNIRAAMKIKTYEL